MDLYKEKMKIYAKVELKFEFDCESAFSLVVGQCSPKMISELKCHDEFDTINEEYQLVKLLKFIKKIYFNHKTQDDPLNAIIKAMAVLYRKKQGKDELVEDFALATENRLAVFMALGGTILNVGVCVHVAQDMYGKKYSLLSTDEKKSCDSSSIERVTAMILFNNSDKD